MLNDTRDSAGEPHRPNQTARTAAPRQHGDSGARRRDVGEQAERSAGSPAAATPGAGIALDGARADVLAVLCTAVLCDDRAEGERQLRDLLIRGHSPQELIDVHIPDAARFFGEAWITGGHSFAEVTIAAARLQGWLRDLDTHDPAREVFCLDAPEILLVVPEGSQHTLGAMVVMSRFRRLGALVRLSLGQDARAIGRVVRAGHYDMVALSAAGNEGLDFLAKLINGVRAGLGPAPYVVLGGEILNQYRDASALVGADFGSSDPEEALALCGLTPSPEARSSPTGRSVPTRRDPERVSDRV